MIGSFRPLPLVFFSLILITGAIAASRNRVFRMLVFSWSLLAFHLYVGKVFASARASSHLRSQLPGPFLPWRSSLLLFCTRLFAKGLRLPSDYGSCSRLPAYWNDMVRGLLCGRAPDARGLQYPGILRLRWQRASSIAAFLLQFRCPDLDRLRRHYSSSSDRADVSDPGGSYWATFPCYLDCTARFSSSAVEAENSRRLKPFCLVK